jgi:hypothetical protein
MRAAHGTRAAIGRSSEQKGTREQTLSEKFKSARARSLAISSEFDVSKLQLWRPVWHITFGQTSPLKRVRMQIQARATNHKTKIQGPALDYQSRPQM